MCELRETLVFRGVVCVHRGERLRLRAFRMAEHAFEALAGELSRSGIVRTGDFALLARTVSRLFAVAHEAVVLVDGNGEIVRHRMRDRARSADDGIVGASAGPARRAAEANAAKIV